MLYYESLAEIRERLSLFNENRTEYDDQVIRVTRRSIDQSDSAEPIEGGVISTGSSRKEP